MQVYAVRLISGYWMVNGSAAVHESTTPTSISDPDINGRNHVTTFPLCNGKGEAFNSPSVAETISEEVWPMSH